MITRTFPEPVRSLLAAGALFLLAGCGSGQLAPVSGRVTLDGKPMEHLHVGFSPFGSEKNDNPGMGSYAFTDSEGRFELIQIGSKRPGAVIGKHRVRIRAPDVPNPKIPDGRPVPSTVVIPKEYDKETKIDFEVKPGMNVANFDMLSKGGQPAQPAR